MTMEKMAAFGRVLFNNNMNALVGFSPFKIIYGKDPPTLIYINDPPNREDELGEGGGNSSFKGIL